jgi:hypothetical protein
MCCGHDKKGKKEEIHKKKNMITKMRGLDIFVGGGINVVVVKKKKKKKTDSLQKKIYFLKFIKLIIVFIFNLLYLNSLL